MDSLILCFAGKKMADFKNLFFPYDFEKVTIEFRNILKMNESNSIETIDRTNLTDQTKFRLNEISEIEIVLTKKLKKEC